MKIALRTIEKSHSIIVLELTGNLLKHIKNGLEVVNYAYKNFPFNSGLILKIPIDDESISIYKLRSTFIGKIENGEEKLNNSFLEHLCFDEADYPSSVNYIKFDDDEKLNFFMKNGGQHSAIIIEQHSINIESTDYNSRSFLSETILAAAFELL